MKKLAEIDYVSEKGSTSLWYEDKNMIVEDIIENGNREITYNISRYSGEIEPPVFKIDKNSNVDITSYKYFDYISDKNIPVFKHITENQQYKCKFENEGKNQMEFILKFPFDIKILELGNTVLALYNTIDNPFDFKNKVFNEIIYEPKNGSLLIFDYRNKEVYGLDNKYELLFSGNLDKDGKLISYTKNNKSYIYKYNNNEIIDHRVIDNSNEIRFVEDKTPYSITRYALLPYIKTSYGAEVVSKNNEIIVYTCTSVVEDNQIIENRYYDLITYSQFNKIIESSKNDSI